MSAVQSPPILPVSKDPGKAAQSSEPQPRKWTRDEYYQAAAMGWFRGKRVVLLAGEAIEMPAQGNWHCISLEKSERILRRIFPEEQYWVRGQNPLDLPDGSSDPEPDLAVVAGSPDDFKQHPSTALLIVEVSDSSLRLDRRKASAYAAAGVADYWIVNLSDHVVEVYRDPIVDATAEFGMRYGSVSTLKPGATIIPIAAPQVAVNVADLLPAQPAGNRF